MYNFKHSVEKINTQLPIEENRSISPIVKEQRIHKKIILSTIRNSSNKNIYVNIG